MIPLPLHSVETNQFSPADPADPTLVHRGEGGSEVRRSILPGVRVLTEAMPGQRSTTVGFWVPVGSRDEEAGHYGSTHFLEHLLFKGTKKRSAGDRAVIRCCWRRIKRRNRQGIDLLLRTGTRYRSADGTGRHRRHGHFGGH